MFRVIHWCPGQVAGPVGAASQASSGAAGAREALKLAYEAYSGEEIDSIFFHLMFLHAKTPALE